MRPIGTDRRGQLVLLAAAVIAFALATGALAYLQVGVHPDIDETPDEASSTEIVTALERSVHDASKPVPATYDWEDRDAAVEAVRGNLRPRIDRLRTSDLERSAVHDISYDADDAATWAAEDCPGGPDRQFGECEAIDGVVVQERAGETHVLGVAFEIQTTSERTTRETNARVTGQR